MSIADVKALTFDVFGTVVDWRSSIIRQGEEWGRTKNITVDWTAFTDAWHVTYRPSMNRVNDGEDPWTSVHAIYRRELDALFDSFGVTELKDEEKDQFNHAWCQLDPWPDSVAGLTRLKKKYILSTLSNGDISMLTRMAKFGGLP